MKKKNAEIHLYYRREGYEKPFLALWDVIDPKEYAEMDAFESEKKRMFSDKCTFACGMHKIVGRPFIASAWRGGKTGSVAIASRCGISFRLLSVELWELLSGASKEPQH